MKKNVELEVNILVVIMIWVGCLSGCTSGNNSKGDVLKRGEEQRGVVEVSTSTGAVVVGGSYRVNCPEIIIEVESMIKRVDDMLSQAGAYSNYI